MEEWRQLERRPGLLASGRDPQAQLRPVRNGCAPVWRTRGKEMESALQRAYRGRIRSDSRQLQRVLKQSTVCRDRRQQMRLRVALLQSMEQPSDRRTIAKALTCWTNQDHRLETWKST